RKLHSLERRDALRCDDAPCIDGSNDKICGYGPTYCGQGNCTSQCDAIAMCGQYSENADMPCGATPKRKIGYYQSWNQRDRKCNKVAPSQLNTDGYTHLFFSFASIDPNSYNVVPANPDDIQIMKEFTALSKDGKLKTWIAIGGFDFSNPEAATHTTWSDMVSTKANRAAFISSAKTYMDEYGFTGVDLDWEYPGAPERGGKKLVDTRNFSLLLKEMRAAYGTAYGISLTLAPDYWYLRWFDAKAMEPNVDFFGFMAYDLHGSWDMDVKTLGSLVRGQADIREISKNTEPLWFDGLNPAKLNFGLAAYGRGYTLAHSTCDQLLCPFKGPSKPAPCTAFDGVMSLVEIKQLIKDRGIEPEYLSESMMKQITWDDQWIGYDDEETFAAKEAWAYSKCFGGTMVWSIDFQASGSGGTCVSRSRELSSATTISVPPYATSLEVAPGSTTTIVITVPPITTNSMEFYNVPIPSEQSVGSFQPTPSFTFPPVITTITAPGGVTQIRTLVVPPWPRITSGVPGQSTTTGNPSSTTLPPVEPAVSWISPPAISKSPYSLGTHLPGPSTVIPTGTWPSGTFISVPTDVPDEGEEGDDGKGSKTSCKVWFFFVCIKWDDLSIGGWQWPPFPPGIIGPGPPPSIEFPPGLTLHGSLPPWPKITIGPDLRPTFPPKPADCEPQSASLCKTTTSFGTTAAGGATKTTTTAVQSTCATIVGCKAEDVEATTTIAGPACTRPPTRREVDADSSIDADEKSMLDGRWDDPNIWWMCGETDSQDGIIWPQDQSEAGQTVIRNLLNQRDSWLFNNNVAFGYKEVRATGLDFTAFYYVSNLGPMAKAYFSSALVPEV
ncbi:oviduct-specific glycoprotein, partial [Xylariales sp. AK1849]